MTLYFNILDSLYLRNCKLWKLILGRDFVCEVVMTNSRVRAITEKFRKLVLDQTLAGVCRCETSYFNIGVTFDPDSASMFSLTVFEMYFSCHKYDLLYGLL